MTPDQVRELLPVYADGELPPDQHAELERHLAAAPQLREEVARWAALRRCAQRVVHSSATPAALRSRIAGELASARRLRIPYRAAALALAAAATIAAAVYVYRGLDRPVRPGGPVQVAGMDVTASQFAMIYRKCALNHDDRLHKHGSDPAAVRAELTAAQGYEMLVPDLATSGYKLDGVCPCFPDKGVKAIHAFYRKDNGDPSIVSFFSIDRCVTLKQCRPGMCCKKDPTKRVYDLAIDNEVTLVKWDERGRSYAVVGRMSSDDLIQLASSVDVAALDSGARLAHHGGD